ncbi:MAG TPA: triose-phosphate isomerase [Patescibacteria group bacterium]
MILINFKAYEETFGDKAVELAKICKEASEETGVEIIPVVSALDVYRVKKEAGNKKVYIQAVDNITAGAHSGSIAAEAAKLAGADGCLINHSEKRLPPGTIKQLLERLPETWDKIVCIQTMGQAERWAKGLKATYFAYEPSELIGSTEKSVASEKSQIIRKAVEMLAPTPVLVGAGIHSPEDVKVSLEMGAKGLLIATNIVKSKQPKDDLRKLAEVFVRGI